MNVQAKPGVGAAQRLLPFERVAKQTKPSSLQSGSPAGVKVRTTS
jgi:hypothetical protein